MGLYSNGSGDDRGEPTTVAPVMPVGVEGYKRSNGYIYEEFHPKLKGKRALRVFREMAQNSPIAGALLLLLECLITQSDQNIEIAKGNEGLGEALRLRDIVETCFDDMNTTRTAFLSDVCSMFWAGFSLFETTYKLRRGPDSPEWCRSKYDDGVIGWADHQSRAQETVDRWEFKNNQLVGFHQRPWNEGREVYLPFDGRTDSGAPVQCLHFKTKHARGNPEGYSLLRNAYRSYWHGARLEDLEGLGAYRDMAGVLTQAVPPQWLTAGATAGQRAAVEKFRRFVERANRGDYEGLVVPSEKDANGKDTGFKTWLMQNGGRQAMQLDPVVRRHESRMAVSMLGELVLLGTGGSGASGSWALSSSKTSMLSRGVRALMTNIEDVINGVAIPRLFYFNGWDIRLAPVFRFGDIESDESIELLGAIAQAVAAGVFVSGPALDRHLRERFGLPMEDEGALPLVPPTTQPMPDAIPAPGQATPPVEIATEQKSEEPLSDNEEQQAEEAIDRGMTVEEIAEQLRVSPGVIRNAIASGQIPGAKIGRTYRAYASDVRSHFSGGRR